MSLTSTLLSCIQSFSRPFDRPIRRRASEGEGREKTVRRFTGCWDGVRVGILAGTAAALTGGDSRVREWSEVVAFSEDGGSGRERTECSISEQRCFFGYPLASL